MLNYGWKRLLSGLLALVLIIGVLPPATVAAEETEPSTETTEILETVETAPAETAESATVPAETVEEPSQASEPEEPAAETTEVTVPEETAAETTETTEPVTETTYVTEPELPENVQAVQALIDALPDVASVTEEDYDAVQAAYDAYEALTEEEKALVQGAEKFEELFGWFNEQVETLDGTSGSCGDNLTWNFYPSSGLLKISGTGDMTDYYFSKAPWSDYQNDIKKSNDWKWSYQHWQLCI